MSDILSASRNELIDLVYELYDKVQVLEGENAHLRELLVRKGGGKGPGASLPEFVKPNVRVKKKIQPRKKREGSFHRRREIPTERIFHSLTTCPECGGKVGKPSVAYTRQVLELPVVSYTVIEHVVTKHWCLNCKKRVSPKVDWNKYTLGRGRIGLNLATTITLLRDRLRLPVNLLKMYLKLVYGLDLSEGEITKVLQTVAAIGKPRYNQLRQDLLTSDFVHGDETGGREQGRNGYFWSFSTPQTHYLIYRKSRGSKVVEEILGKDGGDYQGVVVSDFYAAYNAYAGFHQRCWVHLFRDIKELRKQYPHHPPLNRWAQRVKRIWEEAKDYTGPPSNTPLGLALQLRTTKQHEFEKKLKEVCKPYLYRETPMSTLSGRLITYLPEMFTFVRVAGVPSHNNPAERILRHTVVTRKISGGTRSPLGSETKVVLTSLFDTWHLRHLNLFDQCRLMLSTCQ